MLLRLGTHWQHHATGEEARAAASLRRRTQGRWESSPMDGQVLSWASWGTPSPLRVGWAVLLRPQTTLRPTQKDLRQQVLFAGSSRGGRSPLSLYFLLSLGPRGAPGSPSAAESLGVSGGAETFPIRGDRRSPPPPPPPHCPERSSLQNGFCSLQCAATRGKKP